MTISEEPFYPQQITQAVEIAGRAKVRGYYYWSFFVDGTMLSLDPPLQACRMKIGEQKHIQATRPRNKQHRNIFGANNWDTNTYLDQCKDEEQCCLHPLPGRVTGEAVSHRTGRVGDG